MKKQLQLTCGLGTMKLVLKSRCNMRTGEWAHYHLQYVEEMNFLIESEATSEMELMPAQKA